MIHGIYNSVISNTQAKQVVMSFYFFNIFSVGKLFDFCNYSFSLIHGELVDKFFCFLFNDSNFALE